MKKAIGWMAGALVVMLGVWMIGTGFRKETTVFVDGYSLNEDGSVMTIHAGVASSMGYIRKVVIRENADGEIKLDFLSAFGGLNGSLAAQSTYEIPLKENSVSISLAQGDQYRLILRKEPDSGEWIPVGWTPGVQP